MTDIEIKNKLLTAYSRNFGNNVSGLAEAAREHCIDDYNIFKEEFDAIQSEMYNYIDDYTEKENIQLTGAELEAITKAYCEVRFAWIDAEAFRSLMDYLAWICWHEGILK